MKHVLVLNQFALPRSQGGGTRHIDLFSRVAGWEAKIVAGNRNYTTQDTYTSDDERLKLVPVPGHSNAGIVRMLGWGLFAVQATAIGLVRRDIDAVYASTPHLLAPVAGGIVAKVRRVPFIVEVRDLWPESIIGAGALRRGSRMHRALGLLERRIYESADHIVAVTPGWEPHFTGLGISPDKVTVIPNGTEPADFDVSEDRTALRAEFSMDGPTAVYAGAHGPANALGLVLDAARELPELTILLVGAGTEKQRLQQQAEKLSNVRFLDPMPKSELARVLTAADIGIHCIEPLPVLTTGMSPNKLFDYMAAGLPIVSNAREGLRRVVSDGECGHTGGPDSLARSLRQVLDADTDTRAAWSRRGRALVAEKFSRSGAATTLGAVLNDARNKMARSRSTAPAKSDIQVVHLTTAHRASDNRIFRKEVTSLHEHGVNVTLVAVHPHDEIVEGVPITALPTRKSRLARMVLGQADAYRALRRVRPQLLHIHDPELIPLGVIWKIHTRGSVLFDAHEDLPKQVMGKPYLPAWSRRGVATFARGVELLADRSFDAIVAATPRIAENFSNEHTTLVQNFPWMRDFAEPTPYSYATAQRFTYVGGLTHERGATEMLTALESLGDAASLTVAGPLTPQVEIELQQSARSNYLGVLPAGDVPKVISDAQVGYVVLHPLPNYIESQPTKLFEYMAAGRPFIASDFPLWRSLFGEDDCGVFVDPTDVDAITRAARALIADPARAEAMGNRGRQAIIDRFNFEREGAQLAELTTHLLAR